MGLCNSPDVFKRRWMNYSSAWTKSVPTSTIYY
jgi:hypothetical protein